MGLLLPVLLLGLAQPVDQTPTPASTQPETQVQGEKALLGQVPAFVATPGPVEPTSNKFYQRPQKGERVCYTMRSYIFERRDDLAPEMVGMTTCEPAQASSMRQVRRGARLVPAK